ncbi:hypothetical protein SH1V18_37550 [Vallitalea longa]|uniref:DUF4358 domain-containing protein n=1 Tax=Vallitalea longa TaxID=2936439 RepID=A0A9W6DG58_9FIRM|nr:DUF4358 domain-containing protein [Vallitalea longa]GKX31275.1 hypothetical protein SH1V18_37550 [Vallitalea longa]
MKKNYCILFAIIISLFAFVGCKNDDKEVTLDISDLATNLNEKIEFVDDLTKIDDSSIQTIYQIDYAVASEVYVSSGATAEEIAVFELEDKEDADKAYKACEERIETQKEAFETYIPEEMEKLDNAVIKKVGKYVIVCIADNNTAEDVISTYVD